MATPSPWLRSSLLFTLSWTLSINPVLLSIDTFRYRFSIVITLFSSTKLRCISQLSASIDLTTLNSLNPREGIFLPINISFLPSFSIIWKGSVEPSGSLILIFVFSPIDSKFISANPSLGQDSVLNTRMERASPLVSTLDAIALIEFLVVSSAVFKISPYSLSERS